MGLDALGALLPISILVNAIAKVTTGNNMSVGSVTAELKLLDSATDKLLFVGRRGTKYNGEFD